ncbi:MAG: fibronectin type III domain-containing protein [Bacteroidota bacterium]
MRKSILFLVAFSLLVMSCGDDDETAPENRPPGNFQITTSVNNRSATISWTPSEDPDGDQVTYSVELEGETILENSSNNQLIVNELDYSTSYSGTVVAEDEDGLTNQEEFAFQIGDEPNDSPEVPVLDIPSDSQTGVSGLPEFSWQEATDPNGDQVLYDLFLDTVNPPESSLANDIKETSFQTTSMLVSGTVYYWKVVAKDNKGASTESQISSFTTNSSPTAATPESPTNGAINTSLKPTLLWQASEDPDVDPITYDIYLDQSANPSTKIASSISQTSFLINTELDMQTTYYWKVVASDGLSAETASQVSNFTTQNVVSGTLITANADFSIRYNHTSLVFDNKMWVIGGLGQGFKNDVWYSEDGSNWTEATDAAAFGQRGEHASVVFDGKMWVIGGRSSFSTGSEKNDVWFSEDGINWIQATASANFTARYIHKVLVYNNKMWLIGGRNSSSTTELTSEVWSSSDGINWGLETDTAPVCCGGFTASVFANKMWYIGGFSDDIYSSTDGINWTQENAEAEFGVRILPSSTVFDNRLWIIAGRTINNTRRADVWYSDDGITWIEGTSDAGFVRRSSHTTITFDNKIWLIGGDRGGVGAPFFNDVWAIE